LGSKRRESVWFLSGKVFKKLRDSFFSMRRIKKTSLSFSVVPPGARRLATLEG